MPCPSVCVCIAYPPRTLVTKWTIGPHQSVLCFQVSSLVIRVQRIASIQEQKYIRCPLTYRCAVAVCVCAHHLCPSDIIGRTWRINSKLCFWIGHRIPQKPIVFGPPQINITLIMAKTKEILFEQQIKKDLAY